MGEGHMELYIARGIPKVQTSQAVLEMLPRCEVNDGYSLLCDDDQGVIIGR